MDKIDLHTHTTISDGTMTPTELIAYAKEKELKAIAITDHDGIDAIEEAIKEAEKYDIEIVPSIEFATDYNGTELHILAHYIDYKNADLLSLIKSIQYNRQNRNEKMIQKLNNLGFDVSVDELYAISKNKNIVTRAHFALLLLQKGYVETRDEAFKKYISAGCPAYVPRNLMSVYECIKLIQKFNGIPTLAHPTLYKMNMHEIELLIKELSEYGLKAVEAIYPLHTKQQEGDIKAIAKKYNLKISGGTDFHGDNKPNIDLGTGINHNITIPYKVLEDLKSII